jgi:hypothetical protein
MQALAEEFPALFEIENCEPAPPFEEEAIDKLAFELWHDAAESEQPAE